MKPSLWHLEAMTMAFKIRKARTLRARPGSTPKARVKQLLVRSLVRLGLQLSTLSQIRTRKARARILSTTNLPARDRREVQMRKAKVLSKARARCLWPVSILRMICRVSAAFQSRRGTPTFQTWQPHFTENSCNLGFIADQSALVATTRGQKTKTIEQKARGISDTDDTELSDFSVSLADASDESDGDDDPGSTTRSTRMQGVSRRGYRAYTNRKGVKTVRHKLEHHHPELKTMWEELEARPVLKSGKIEQPQTISRLLKPFQLEGVAWMRAMEQAEWKGGLLGDEMGLGKTIQA